MNNDEAMYLHSFLRKSLFYDAYICTCKFLVVVLMVSIKSSF